MTHWIHREEQENDYNEVHHYSIQRPRSHKGGHNWRRRQSIRWGWGRLRIQRGEKHHNWQLECKVLQWQQQIGCCGRQKTKLCSNQSTTLTSLNSTSVS